MLSSLIDLVYTELKPLDAKASYFIAKELALIDISLLWYEDKHSDNIARLNSLAEHVKLTYKGNVKSKIVAGAIKSRANEIEEEYII